MRDSPWLGGRDELAGGEVVLGEATEMLQRLRGSATRTFAERPPELEDGRGAGRRGAVACGLAASVFVGLVDAHEATVGVDRLASHLWRRLVLEKRVCTRHAHPEAGGVADGSSALALRGPLREALPGHWGGLKQSGAKEVFRAGVVRFLVHRSRRLAGARIVGGTVWRCVVSSTSCPRGFINSVLISTVSEPP